MNRNIFDTEQLLLLANTATATLTALKQCVCGSAYRVPNKIPTAPIFRRIETSFLTPFDREDVAYMVLNLSCLNALVETLFLPKRGYSISVLAYCDILKSGGDLIVEWISYLVSKQKKQELAALVEETLKWKTEYLGNDAILSDFHPKFRRCGEIMDNLVEKCYLTAIKNL